MSVIPMCNRMIILCVKCFRGVALMVFLLVHGIPKNCIENRRIVVLKNGVVVT